MSLAKISIDRPVFAWMLFLASLVFGAIGFRRLGLSQLPDVDFPVVSVNLTLAGASPEVMETEVVDVAEEALMAVEGVKQVSSSSNQGSARITLEFDLGRDLDAIVQDVQAKLGQIARRLPPDMDPPTVSKTNPEDQPIIWVATSASAGTPTKDLMLMVRDRLKDEFQTVPGVSEISLGGFVDRNLRIWIDPQKLQSLQLSVDDVMNTVGREHLEVPAGRIESATQEMNVRFLGEAPSVKAFGDLPITSRGGAPVWRKLRVRDVAQLEDGLDDIRRISRFNGEMAVGMGIRKMRGSNAVAVGRAVKERLAEVAKTLPPGWKIQIANDNTRFVEEAESELEQTLLLAALFTGLVCWVFLGSWATTVNVLLSIPFSIIGTFTVLYFLGFTRNTFTLLALSLAVGVVVDDAIMVLENIVRHKEMGKDKRAASLDGATEISFAAMAATFSIVAIFLPVAFMQGVIGRYFFQFGITISVAALLSLVEALTLTPMRTSQFLEDLHEKKSAVDRVFDRLRASYGRGLVWTLDHRWTVLMLAGLVFVAGFFLAGRLKKEMLPAQDQSRLLFRLSLPTGTSLEVMDDATKKAEAWLKSRPELLKYYCAVGGFGGGDVSSAILFVTLKDKGERPVVDEELPAPGKKPGKPAAGAKADPSPSTIKVHRALSQAEFGAVARREIGKLVPKLRVSAQDLSQRGFSTGRGYPVEFTVRGPDWDVLASSSEALAAAMRKDPALTDVDSDYLTGQEEVQVIPDREAAARYGVSMQSLGDVIGALVGGRVTGKFTEGGRRNDVRVRLLKGDRNKPEDILKLSVRNNRGELVRLSSLVKLEQKPSLQSIKRVNRERAITLYANAQLGVSADEALQRALQLAAETLPKGYRAVPTGSSQAGADANKQLWGALALGVLVAYMILASQFNSFIHPFTVLLAMPFSFTGAFAALLIFHQSLNIYSFIGLILLMGLVKKNSILLVDVTNQFRAQGLGADEALKTASPLRLRPILMTSLATIAGASPAAFSFGAGSETLKPMGIAIIGGMLISTLLTLFVVPAAYSLLSRLQRDGKPMKAASQKAPVKLSPRGRRR